MIQTRFDKRNTACDDFIIWFSCLFYYAIHCANCFCDVPDELEFLADCIVLTVDGCMHAQQHLEIEEIKKTGYTGPPQHILAAMPPAQQKMMCSGKPGGGSGIPGMAVGAGAAAAGMGGAAATQSRPQSRPQAQQQNQSSFAQQQSYSQAPPMQQSMPQVQAQVAQPVQVQCGACQQVFGSPQTGVTVACPFCTAHNVVPAQQGPPMGMPLGGSGMYGGSGGMYGGGSGMYGGGQMQQQQGGRRPNAMMMGAGIGAGAIGGMMMADALF